MKNTQQHTIDATMLAAMRSGEAFSVYKKVILGKAHIVVIDPYTGPTSIIMKGDPKKNDDGCYYQAWTETEDNFFKRMNKRHLESGNIIRVKEVAKVEKTEEEVYNTLSEEELEKILKKPFLTLKNALAKMTAEAAVFRILNKAEEMEKSEKIITAIRARLSEIQGYE